jgi:hypothetical protein
MVVYTLYFPSNLFVEKEAPKTQITSLILRNLNHMIRLSFSMNKCLQRNSKVISKVCSSCFISIENRGQCKTKDVLMKLMHIHTHFNYQIILFIGTE